MKKYELSTVQKNIWMLESFYANSAINNITTEIQIDGILDFKIVNEAVNLVIESNDIIRSKFFEENNEVYRIVEPYKPGTIRLMDLRKYTKEEVRKYIDNFAAEPMNVQNKLSTIELIYTAEKKSIILTKFHHLIGDAWSLLSIMANNLVEAIYRLNRGEKIEANEYISEEYNIFVDREKEYAKTNKYAADKEYFAEKFKGLETCTVIKNNNLKRTNNAKRKINYINEKEYKKIKEFCNEKRISEYALILTALTLYLYRISQKNDVVIGTPILNRLSKQEKSIIGLFISTVPLRFKFEEDIDFIELCRIVTSELFTTYRHQKYPFSEISKDFYQNSDVSKMFDIMLSYQNAKYGEYLQKDEIDVNWDFAGCQQEQLIIHVLSDELNDKLKIHYDYLVDLFDEEEIDYIHERLLRIILDGISKNPKINEIKIVTKKEETLLLKDFIGDRVESEYPEKESIISLFQKIAKQNEDRVAVKYKDEQLTYLQLDKKVNALATKLRKEGVTRNSIVAIKLDKGINQIIAMLATLKAGGAYMPIHMDWPDDRIIFMLEDSKAKACITTEEYMPAFACIDEYNGNTDRDLIIDIKEFFEETDIRKCEELELISKPEDLAYIIYTSGTTGKPKGTLIENKNILMLLKAKKFQLDITNEDVWTMFHAYTFDFSVWEMYGALLNGAKLVIVPSDVLKNIDKYVKLLKKEKVTILNHTPSMLFNLIEAEKYSEKEIYLRYLMVGAETVYTTKLKEFHERYPEINICIVYGITETTCISTIKKLEKEDYEKNTFKIGTALPFRKIYILDKNLQLMPIGVEGELCEATGTASRGYLNNEELTNKKFVPCPYSKSTMYRTGDVAKRDLSGDLVYVGRNDNQVKIRGFRIELDEIENLLLKIECIDKILVFVHEQKILAFIKYKPDKDELNFKKIKNILLENIPTYMLPTLYKVNTFPINVNGKIDRKKLLNQIEKDLEKNINQKEKPKTELEKQIYKIIMEVLEGQLIGVTDHFEENNIDSLKILRISLELRKNNYLVTAQDLYNEGTIRKVAELIEQRIKNSANTFSVQKGEYLNINKPSKKFNLERVFITGATGFFGVNILEPLLMDDDVNKIYCLVRDSKDLKGADKLDKQFARMFKNNKALKEKYDLKVRKISGDFTKEKLGIDIDLYKKLALKVTSVINCAANVKHYGAYDNFYRDNVESVKNITEFAKLANASLAQISTQSVAGFVRTDSEDKSVYNEDVLDIGQSFLDSVYMRTKYEAEKYLINEDSTNDLNLKIFRMGNLMPRADNGAFQVNEKENAFLKKLDAIMDLKAVSTELEESEVEISPVDISAKAVYKLMKFDDTMRIYNIANENIKTKNVIDLIRKYGKEINTCKSDELIEKIKNNNNESVALLANELIFSEYIIKSTDSTKTIELLSQFNVKWNKLDMDYIEKLIGIVVRW
ncbi:MAG: amino acid adenylation domain-containing protein [Clostridia bacterium]